MLFTDVYIFTPLIACPIMVGWLMWVLDDVDPASSLNAILFPFFRRRVLVKVVMGERPTESRDCTESMLAKFRSSQE